MYISKNTPRCFFWQLIAHSFNTADQQLDTHTIYIDTPGVDFTQLSAPNYQCHIVCQSSVLPVNIQRARLKHVTRYIQLNNRHEQQEISW